MLAQPDHATVRSAPSSVTAPPTCRISSSGSPLRQAGGFVGSNATASTAGVGVSQWLTTSLSGPTGLCIGMEDASSSRRCTRRVDGQGGQRLSEEDREPALRTNHTYMKVSPTFRHSHELNWFGNVRSRSLSAAGSSAATHTARSASSAAATVVNKASMVAAGIAEGLRTSRGWRGSDDFRSTEAGRRRLEMMSGHEAMAAQRGGHV